MLYHVRFRTKDAPRVFTVAPKAGPVRTFEGLTLTPLCDGAFVLAKAGRNDPAMYLVERLYGDDARARIGEGP